MEMYRADDVVVYDVYGLCRVKEIKKLSFVRSETKEVYYVLVPLTGAASQYYVPVGNEKAVSKLRRPFSKEKPDEILSQVKDENVFTAAKKLLNEEFSYALGIEKEKVSEYIGRYLLSKE